MEITVAEDLAVAIGEQSARLNPGEAFKLAEQLIRTATVRMVAEEVDRVASGVAEMARLAKCDVSAWDERWGAEDRAVSKS